MNDGDWVVLAAASPAQAHMLKNLLHDNGIDSEVAEAGHPAEVELPAPASRYEERTSRVLVPPDQLDAAQEIFNQVHQALSQGVSLPALAELEAAHGQDSAWPACPHCSRPRLARCPICETSGTHFAEAFLPENLDESLDSPRRPMYLCPTCDEPLHPEFLARCEWCGHRFGDGVALPERSQGQPPLWLAELGLRAFIVMAGLAAMLAAIFGWFYFVLR